MRREVLLQFMGKAGLGLRMRQVGIQVAAQQNGTTPDSVDAKNKVQQRPGERHEPDEADPKHSRPGIPLVEHSMDAGDHRQEQCQGGSQVMPDAMNFLEHSEASTRKTAWGRKASFET